MKTKCPKCGIGKARRHCAREGNAEICSECCASIRDEDCGGCVHYAAARQYEDKRQLSTTLADGHFMMEVNDEVQETVNTALETRPLESQTGRANGRRTPLGKYCVQKREPLSG